MHYLTLDIVENVVASNQQLLDRYLSKESRAYLYGLDMAYAYGELEKYNDALNKCNKVLALYQGAPEIWSPSNLGRDMKKL